MNVAFPLEIQSPPSCVRPGSGVTTDKLELTRRCLRVEGDVESKRGSVLSGSLLTLLGYVQADVVTLHVKIANTRTRPASLVNESQALIAILLS